MAAAGDNGARRGGDDRPESSTGGSLVRAVPVLARLAAAASWRATVWTVEAYVGVGNRALRGAMNGETPAQIIQGAEAELREYLRRLLGVSEARDDQEPDDRDGAEPAYDGRPPTATLRERGEELLRRSAEVGLDEETHPAFDRILDQLAPDEGRILRLLAQQGPQPSVDVRTGGPMGVVKSDLVAPGLTMIAAEAGCRHPERLHSYLNNLYRLGLIWFSREQIDDIQRYLVLESQPDVAAALDEAGRGKTIRRSIHLTAFGEDFCSASLPLDTAELEALGGSGDPDVSSGDPPVTD